MPEPFAPGDHVTSDRYGPGRVTALSARPGYVLVTFAGAVDNQYHAITGARYAGCGTDRIKREDPSYAGSAFLA